MIFPPFSRIAPAKNLVAFTLVELLVTIGIIAVLATLLVRGGYSVQESSQSTKCLSNLRQLGVAARLYEAENNQKLVPMALGTGAADAQTFRALLAPYLDNSKEVFICPSDRVGRKAPTPGFGWPIPASYGIVDPGKWMPSASYTERLANQLFDYLTVVQNGRTAAAVVAPARTIFIADMGRPDQPGAPFSEWTEKNRSPSAGNYGYCRMPPDPGFSSPGDPWNIFLRHAKRRTNALFFDGHAETLDFQTQIIDHPPGDPLCIYDNQ